MVLLDFHFYSQALQVTTAAYVLLPEPDVLEKRKHKPLPTLYLLHGLSDDHTKWLRMTQLETFSTRYYAAIVMPAVNRSFYTDMAHGAKYFSFVSEELPRVMEGYLPLAKEREGRFAAGLSMGGYGAMKLGLRLPQRYAAVASLSGAVEIEKDYERCLIHDEFINELNDCFGSYDALIGGDDCVTRLAERAVVEKRETPRIYMACGTEDFLYESNEDFVTRFGKPLHIDYHTGHGAHTWEFWNTHIEKVLEWLPLERVDQP